MTRPPPCRKRKYRDRVAAQLALAEIAAKDRPNREKTEKRAYHCRLCHRYHLTSWD